jgi:hypothetical protein
MPPKLSDKGLEKKYDEGGFRIAQERNDFLLPQVVDFVRQKKWMNLRPEYQRRLVWDRKRKSRLIESLLMNVPVPPIFIFEHDLSRYEVMDGQQRLNSILDFYENGFALTGLERWAELKGRRYKELPERIQRGLDRRRISAVVLLAESGGTPDQAKALRKLVFERLNTGGQSLQNQELRNCIYSGPLNDLLVTLAGNRTFNELWGIPPYEDNITGDRTSAELANNRYYKRMLDVEIVLRFFTFRAPPTALRGSIKGMLDDFMEQNVDAGQPMLGKFKALFESRIKLAKDIFGKDAFRIPGSDGDSHKLSEPLYDALMVAIDRLYENKDGLIASKTKIRSEIAKKIKGDEAFYELIVGRANTAQSLRDRIDEVEKLLRKQL